MEYVRILPFHQIRIVIMVYCDIIHLMMGRRKIRVIIVDMVHQRIYHDMQVAYDEVNLSCSMAPTKE